MIVEDRTPLIGCLFFISQKRIMMNKRLKPLIIDIKFLGKILGDVLKHYEGEEFFNIVENIRKNSKSKKLDNVTRLIEDLDDKEKIVQSFSLFLNLANIAESFHRERRTIYYNKKDIVQKYSLNDLFNKDIDSNKLEKELKDLKIELVLTAHPTEIKRKSLIANNKEIYNLLGLKEQGEDVEEELFRILSRVWTIDDTKREKPTPEEEARRARFYVLKTVYDLVPRKVKEIKKLAKLKDIELPLDYMPFVFSSWMGGDRDGNPFVKEETTISILKEQKELIVKLYKKDVQKLHDKLAMSFDDDNFPSTMYPYRSLLDQISYSDIDKDYSILDKIFNHLKNNKSEHIAMNGLYDLMLRFKCFSYSLMKLDIRQDSSVHVDLVNMLTKGKYSKMKEEEKISFLSGNDLKLESNIPNDFLADVDNTFGLVQRQNEDFNCYIISMTESVTNLMEVQYLLKRKGLTDFPIVPLFETVEDLENSTGILEKWFTLNPNIQEQMVMLGYSDSMKSGGKFASVYGLKKAQKKIIDVCKRNNVKVIFFHGRGGSIARGGGPIYEGILSQPKGSVNGHFRTTIQGEMIDSTFSFMNIASRNLDIYLSSCIEKSLLHKYDKGNTPLYEAIAQESKQKYRSLLEDSNFMTLYNEITPINEMSLLKIGSRPSKRKNNSELSSLRAIPWVFSWTQNRLILPSWYGIGTALKSQDINTLKEEYNSSVFFRSFIDLTYMVISKTREEIFSIYGEKLVSNNELYEIILKEYRLTKKLISKIVEKKKYDILMSSIEARNPYVDPINVVQIISLKNYRDYTVNAKALILSFTGVANGLRNTG